MKCFNCEKEIDDNSKKCPFCNEDIVLDSEIEDGFIDISDEDNNLFDQLDLVDNETNYINEKKDSIIDINDIIKKDEEIVDIKDIINDKKDETLDIKDILKDDLTVKPNVVIEKEKKKFSIFKIIIIIFIIIIIILGVYYFTMPKKDTSTKYIYDVKENELNTIIHSKPTIDWVYSILGPCYKDTDSKYIESSCKELDKTKKYFVSNEDKIMYTKNYIRYNYKELKNIKIIDKEVYILNTSFNDYVYKLFDVKLPIKELLDLSTNNYVKVEEYPKYKKASYTFVARDDKEEKDGIYTRAIDIIDIRKVKEDNLYETNSISKTTVIGGYTNKAILDTAYLKYKIGEDGRYIIVSLTFEK